MPTDEKENCTAYGNQGAQKKLQDFPSFAYVVKLINMLTQPPKIGKLTTHYCHPFSVGHYRRTSTND